MSEQLSALIPRATPPAWLGVMGGGQLGRMLAHAAQAMGYQIAVLEPAADCPAAQVADAHICAPYDDAQGLAQLAEKCVAVTTEFENVPAQSLALLAQTRFVAPAAQAVSIAQDRMLEKAFFLRCAASSQVGPAAHALIESAADVANAPDHLFPGILKTIRLGYDGKGQIRVADRAAALRALNTMQGASCVLEQMLPLALEISVLAARGADGQAVVYPIAENVHRDGILFTTTVPSPNVSASIAAQAQAATLAIIHQLDYVGVLCIEFFILQDGSLVVNEMAPRPHNSGHYTIDACSTSQFAQQVRAMARLPLGETRQHSPSVMLNLLGDLWFSEGSDAPREPAWEQILALPGACLHLYGKHEARRARKMGHITFIAPALTAAQQQLQQACGILGIAL